MIIYLFFGKMFEEIAYQDLVVGAKYKIKDLPYARSHYTGIFKGNYLVNHVECQNFENVFYHCYSKQNYLNVAFSRKFYFRFIPQKERIQQAMESRALIMILKRLINDDFTW
jgi:hypothetical protein